MASLAENRAAAAEKGYIDLAHEAERKHGIPTGMLVGLLEQESGWRPEVIEGRKKSSAGAIGIAQFMPATAKDEGVDPLNVPQAIDGAADYLSRLNKSAGSWTGALTSYNWGIGNYKKYLAGTKKSMPKEAQNYATGVIKRAKNYGNLKAQAAPQPDASGVTAPTVPEAAQLPEQVQAPQPTPASTPTMPSTDIPSAPVVPAADQTMQQTQQPTTQAVGAPVVAQPGSQPTVQDAMAESQGMDPMASSVIPNTSTDFKLKDGHAKEITIDTPQGQQRVIAETDEEAQLITELGASGETGLLQNIPALIQARDNISAKPLIRGRSDAADKLMRDLVRSV